MGGGRGDGGVVGGGGEVRISQNTFAVLNGGQLLPSKLRRLALAGPASYVLK
jgi:hypothetical protein